MQTKSGHTLTRVAAIIVAVILAGACAKIKDISVTSCEVRNISPRGLRSVEVLLAVGVHNPSVEFTVSDIEGEIRNEDCTIATFMGGPVTVMKKSDDVYDLHCEATMGDNLSLFEMLNIVRKKDFSNMKVDVTALVRLKNGVSKTLKYKDMSLEELLNKADLSSKL